MVNREFGTIIKRIFKKKINKKRITYLYVRFVRYALTGNRLEQFGGRRIRTPNEHRQRSTGE